MSTRMSAPAHQSFGGALLLKRSFVPLIATAALVLGTVAVLGSTVSAAPAPRTTPAARYTSRLTLADIARLSRDATHRSIIIMRDQHLDVAGSAATRQAREDIDQAPLRGELAQLRAPQVRSLHAVNAVAATISTAEQQRLAADPAVQAVVPDLAIPRPATRPDLAAGGSPSVRAAAPQAAGQAICPSNPADPLLEPEALQAMNVDFGPGAGRPAAHDIVDGTGIKVAWLADGVDINNPDFQRNGHSIFTDYQDFSGEGTSAPTAGAEAFGDASSIAAQGNQVYDLSTFVSPAHPLPPGCTIRIKGVAPGVSLVGLKVFGTNTVPFSSLFLQAIDRAVNVDKVDVINESFGANPYPDRANDPIALANTAATLAGVTVVASTGDAGTNNTVGTPADAPGVIGVGASTTFRLYRQTSAYATSVVPGGWVSGNSSALVRPAHPGRGGTGRPGLGAVYPQPGPVRRLLRQRPPARQHPDLRGHQRVLAADRGHRRAGHRGVRAHARRRPAQPGAGEADHHEQRDRPAPAGRGAGRRPGQRAEGGRTGGVGPGQLGGAAGLDPARRSDQAVGHRAGGHHSHVHGDGQQHRCPASDRPAGRPGPEPGAGLERQRHAGIHSGDRPEVRGRLRGHRHLREAQLRRASRRGPAGRERDLERRHRAGVPGTGDPVRPVGPGGRVHAATGPRRLRAHRRPRPHSRDLDGGVLDPQHQRLHRTVPVLLDHPALPDRRDGLAQLPHAGTGPDRVVPGQHPAADAAG